jgi:hypothetical protein
MLSHRWIAGIVVVSLALAATPLLAAKKKHRAQTDHFGLAAATTTPAAAPKAGVPRKSSPAKPAAAAPAKPAPPTRPEFTAQEQADALIPGMPDIRFYADNIRDFESALPAKEGPWLVLSTGGEDGAFGAGFMKGWTASGERPNFSVVTGVSTGALMATYVFAGPKYDQELGDNYNNITAADVFELGMTPESLTDNWPLADLITKRVTPQLLSDIAQEHKKGRRLFVATTSLDTGRQVVWNMGLIAAYGTEQSQKLFRQILLASSALPAIFPPVYFDVEADGKKFKEMHVDGGVNGPLFFGPEAYLNPDEYRRMPATEVFAILNGTPNPDFAPPSRMTSGILGRAFSIALKRGARIQIALAYQATQHNNIPFHLAMVDGGFTGVSTGLFEKAYMQALYNYGIARGEKADRFKNLAPQPTAEKAANAPSATAR